MVAMAGKSASRLAEQDYRQLVQQIHDLVRATIPPGATVAVVSKGDPALVNLEGRRGWHFPQNRRGEYAGHYPPNSKEAIAHLEEIRKRGAEYLLFPSTSFWWLDHYREFAAHLEGRYETVLRQEHACLILSLTPALVPAEPDPVDGQYAVGQIRGLVDSLLPQDATVLVLEDAGVRLDLAGRRALKLLTSDEGPQSIAGDERELMKRVETMTGEGAEFLVLVPHLARWWDRYPGFMEHVRARYPLVTRQEHVCEIYDLGASGEEE
jgi:hypothetical protein